MTLVPSALRHPVTVLVGVIGLALCAFLALRQMPRDIFPSLGIPTIYVAQPYGGMDPAQMEGYLTYYYEYHFLYLTGIEHVESKSIQGASLIKLQFHPGTDMSQAMSETVAYVNRARAFMPPGTVPPFITRFDAGSVPVGNLVFASETRSVGEMQDLALNRVRPLFATLPGVSAPPPFGGSARSIVVNLRPARLRAYNMVPDDVVAAIASANVISPSGNIPLGDRFPMVPLNAVVREVKELESVPIRLGTYPAVFVRDVAEVIDGSDLVTSYALVNGHRTVYIPVTKRADASTLSVVKLVRQNLPKFQNVLPDDVRVEYQFDQSPYVTRAISGLVGEGLLGAVLTGLMVLLFLRDWRSALIVIVNIPLALLGAVAALWITHQTINIMTLGGLALAVGILVDEATVTIENVHAHLARGTDLNWAALHAANETALPRLVAMLCVLAIFLPSFFMVGAAKALFVPLSLAVGFSMLASYLLSSTLVPILSAWVLLPNAATRGHGAFDRFRQGYARGLRLLIAQRWIVLSLYLVSSALVIALLVPRVGTEIFPKVDAGQLQVRFRAPPGTRVERTEAVALQTLDIIKQQAGATNIEITLAFVGVHAPSYPINLVYLWNGGSEEGVVQVQFKRKTGLVVARLQEQLRHQFARDLPGVSFSFEPSDIVSRVMSLGASTPIEVAVSGPSLPTNRQFAQKILEKLASVPALRDLQFGQALDYPTVNVTLDRQRGGLLGVNSAQASRSLVVATSSSRFTTPVYWADPNSGVAYQVQVQVPPSRMNSLEDLKNVPVAHAHGQDEVVLLRSIAAVTNGVTVGQFERYNMQRLVTVTANIQDSDIGTVARQVSRAIEELGPPPARVTVATRGQIVPLEQMLDGLRTGLLLAVAVIVLLLVANFQSVKLAVVVISTVPAVIAGVLLTLWLTSTTLNVQSFMGAIMGIGVAVANAILLVTFAERQRMGGDQSDAAALEAAQTRLRPILMTSLAMMAGMLPMAVGWGESGQQTGPLGRAVLGGLAAATVATLLVLPAVFAIVQSRTSRKPASLYPDERHSTSIVAAEGGVS